MRTYSIAASILAADFARLGEEVDNVLAAGADLVHFDVMDNHFVPNLSFGPLVCAALRKHGVCAPIDVHLMVRPVDRLIGEFAAAGASNITFHPQAAGQVDRMLALVHSHGCQAGLAFNPTTPLLIAPTVLDELDLILLMAVEPGFGGQRFLPTTLDKLRLARQTIQRSGRPIRLEVDGGVNATNIAAIAAAGADTFVAGSAIFAAAKPTDPHHYDSVIRNLRAQLAGAGEAE